MLGPHPNVPISLYNPPPGPLLSYQIYQGLNAQDVAHLAEPGNLSPGNRRYQGCMPELFTAVYIRQVDLDRRDTHSTHGISYGHARVCIGSRIYEYAGKDTLGLPYALDNIAFMVGLH